MSNAAMYNKFKTQPISLTLLQRRLTFVGHCYRSGETAYQPISDILLWNYSKCFPLIKMKKGNRSNFRKQLLSSIRYDVEPLQDLMANRDKWSKFVTSQSKKFIKARDGNNYEEFKKYLVYDFYD